jgi:carbamoyltransferase
LGPAPAAAETVKFLDQVGAVYHRFENDDQKADRVAELLASSQVVGWVQGRMEFGPRALGSRSILGDARDPRMQAVMNLKIKFRESFRPFAPSVLQDRAHDYFEMRPDDSSPYMLLVAPVRHERRIHHPESEQLNGLERRNAVRSEVPAITHVDYSARVQTVDAERNVTYYKLLQAFERRTGCPVIINTSFNIRGEPIVCSAAEAYRCFLATNMDALVIDDFLLLKSEQPHAPQHAVDEYLASFQLD